MQKPPSSDTEMTNALLLWHNQSASSAKKSKRTLLVPIVTFGIGALITLFSYALYDPYETTGDFAAASSVLQDFVEDTPIVAVFLGIDETKEMSVSNEQTQPTLFTPKQ